MLQNEYEVCNRKSTKSECVWSFHTLQDLILPNDASHSLLQETFQGPHTEALLPKKGTEPVLGTQANVPQAASESGQH